MDQREPADPGCLEKPPLNGSSNRSLTNIENDAFNMVHFTPTEVTNNNTHHTGNRHTRFLDNQFPQLAQCDLETTFLTHRYFHKKF